MPVGETRTRRSDGAVGARGKVGVNQHHHEARAGGGDRRGWRIQKYTEATRSATRPAIFQKIDWIGNANVAGKEICARLGPPLDANQEKNHDAADSLQNHLVAAGRSVS